MTAIRACRHLAGFPKGARDGSRKKRALRTHGTKLLASQDPEPAWEGHSGLRPEVSPTRNRVLRQVRNVYKHLRSLVYVKLVTHPNPVRNVTKVL
jgi:hypothetical protein